MVVDISKKFLIFEKNHLFSHFFGKKEGKTQKNPDRTGKEKVISTGRSQVPVTTLAQTGRFVLIFVKDNVKIDTENIASIIIYSRLLGAEPTEILIRGNEWIHTHTLHTDQREEKECAYIYPHMHRGLTREKNEHNKDMVERYNIQER